MAKRRRLAEISIERLRELDDAAETAVERLLSRAPVGSYHWTHEPTDYVDNLMYGLTAKRHPLMAAERRWLQGAAFLAWKRRLNNAAEAS